MRTSVDRSPFMRTADAARNRDLAILPDAPTTRTAIALTAAGTAFAVFVVGAVVEAWLISLVRPSEGELTWISDLVLAISLGVVLYLWLNLRSTREALMHLERETIVLDTQLAVASKI